MSELEVQGVIIATLEELQEGLGTDSSEITQGTKPLLDLDFFDSLLGIETTLVLEERLGISCAVDTIFKDKETGEPLAIAQIASLLSAVSKVTA
ncbi:phosphopantetheine-binding protein [Silvibacterium acidisoli]|uniref:phosphopantetheine-binding protein n=1 Tax=Acidobacteriaceae bacterium ZG23-2 TaxID=2883246 RepID=UPI00406D22E4